MTSSPLASARPLFMLGAPRSGTTFATKLLDSHPAVIMTNEVRVFTFFEHAFQEIPTGDKGGLHCARSYGEELVAALEDVVEPVVRATFENIARSRGAAGVRYWGDKNPHHSTCLDMIERSFPDALYLRMRRDPRDVVCSIAEMQGKMTPTEEVQKTKPKWSFANWRRRSEDVAMAVEDEEALVRSSRAVGQSIVRTSDFLSGLPQDRYLEVTYEDLVVNSDAWIERIFGEFLKLEDLDTPRRWVAEQGGHDSHGRFRQSVDFKERSVARWRRHLTAPQVQVVERELGRALKLDRFD